jgi:hypothetical protein
MKEIFVTFDFLNWLRNAVEILILRLSNSKTLTPKWQNIGY